MITQLFSEDIKLIDDKVLKLVDKIDHPIVKEETRRLITTGGKRLRPLFLMWSSDPSTQTMESTYTAAASLELLHTSSLIHDDIIDKSFYRRGTETTLKVFGRERATSIGTVLTMFSIGQIVSLNNEDISTSLADTLEKLCNGELKQLDERFNFESDCADYFKKISSKTASLFALPCKIGGIIADYKQEEIDTLYEIGYNIGCSFQILDDLMDITSSLEITGKECNRDIKNGIITLPYLLLMEKDSSFKECIKNLSSESSDEEFDNILKRLKSTDAIEEAYRYSNTFLDKAREILISLSSEKSREKFGAIIDLLYKNI